MWCFISIIGAAMAQPHNPHQANPKLVVALQQFSWTEGALGDTISTRNAAAGGRLDKEPMFCFETAIKLFFWSCLVYEDYEGVSKPVKLTLTATCLQHVAITLRSNVSHLHDQRNVIKHVKTCYCVILLFLQALSASQAGSAVAVSEGHLEQLMKGLALYNLTVHKVRKIKNLYRGIRY